MAARAVLEFPDPRLRQVAAPVTAFDDTLRRRVDDLFDTLLASGSAVALCAPQIGEPQRILVVDLSERAAPPEVFINPTIMQRSGLGLARESCLSVPGVVVHVWRATRLKVRAFDPAGQAFERELGGLGAVCLQHEMDHFDGKLLVDRMFWLRRRSFERRRGAVASS